MSSLKTTLPTFVDENGSFVSVIAKLKTKIIVSLPNEETLDIPLEDLNGIQGLKQLEIGSKIYVNNDKQYVEIINIVKEPVRAVSSKSSPRFLVTDKHCL